MEDIEQLYIALKNSNLTNKSFDEFVELYKDDDYKLRVHNAVVGKGLYSSDFNKFTSDYALPTVEVEEKVEETKDPSTISEVILSQIPVAPITKLATNIWDGLTGSYEKINTTIVRDDEKSEVQFNQELKDIDENVLNKINTQLNKIKEQSLKQRASLGETRPLNATNLVDLVQVNPEQGITEEVLKKYKNALSKKEKVKLNESFTKENFPGEEFVTDPYTLQLKNQSNKYLGKYNPKINGVGIHDHMFKGDNESGEIKILPEYNEDTPNKQYERAQQYLTDAYPDYTFDFKLSPSKTNYELTMKAPNGNEN